jgi:hypothetical protein
MNSLIKALQTTVQFLESQQIQYMIIGGIANSIYGIPRQTYAIDIKFNLVEIKIENFINDLLAVGSIVVENLVTFLHETGVIPIDVGDVRVDLILASLPFEQEALQRSKKQTIYGIEVNVTRAKGLIIQKAISPRNKDWMDIEGILDNQKSNLDWKYILHHVKQLSEFLADSPIYSKIEKLKDAAKL